MGRVKETNIELNLDGLNGVILGLADEHFPEGTLHIPVNESVYVWHPGVLRVKSGSQKSFDS